MATARALLLCLVRSKSTFLFGTGSGTSLRPMHSLLPVAYYRISSSYKPLLGFRCFSSADSPSKKGKAAPLQERRMRDRVRLWAKGGEGGNGCWSYRRTRTDRYGKPDGGGGGRGGDVILECSAAVWDFSNLQHHLNAKNGGHGVSKSKIGSRGSDKVVQVPVGTVIHLVSGETLSFVEDTSIKSLQPWEIPDVEQASPPKSHQHIDGSVSSLSLSDTEALDDSPLPHPKVHVGRSAPKVSKMEGKADVKYSFSRYKSGDKGIKALYCHKKGIKAVEYDLDTYETDFEEEEDSDGEEYEECKEDEVYAEEEEEEEEVQYSVAELTKPGQRLIVAQGGEGGMGNTSLKKGLRDKRSRKIFEHNDEAAEMDFSDDESHSSLTAGMPGSESILILELKSIADVGLVGMPNAGKSTLLGAISRAKPTVGHYAFTTLRPNIGNLNYDDFFSMTVADIPGLIKGAHENRGLGHAFLRHIERTKVLAYVVDLAATLNGGKGILPWEQLRDLVFELEHHQEGLSQKPSLVVANKIDEEGAEDVYEELKRRVKGVPIFPVCAVLEEGVPELKDGLRRLMDGRELQCLDVNRIMLE